MDVSKQHMKLTDGQPFTSGILKRFGEDLHEDPLVAYRALVDRAHAACLARSTVASNYTPAILVGTQTIGGLAHVSFADNGEALAASEVRTLYAAIRTGRAGAMRRALIEAGADGADSIIGRLGVAMLAAFLIADQVTVTTRGQLAAPADGARYVCTSRTYTADRVHVPRAGTIVQLRVRPSLQHLGAADVVRGALIEHARGLALPIRVGADLTPINA